MGYLILISVVSGALLYFIAAKRNASPAFWLAMGLFFGPFALPFVFFAKTENTKDDNRRSSGTR
jgi:hypothetical protein